MTQVERSAEMARTIGTRIRAARDAADLKQDEFAKQLGFADRQTLSSIEQGERRVQPSELLRISELLRRPIEWFLDPFVVAGEAQFCWRVSPSVSDRELDDHEEQIGQIVGLLRHLRVALKGPSPALGERLWTPSDPQDVSYERARNWGELVAQRLELGAVPAQGLVEAIERKFAIPVLFIDVQTKGAASTISGAMCRLSDLGVIVVNRRESPCRRNFDVAHELFHSLTWDAWTPDRREGAVEGKPSKKPGRRVKRIESLADNFAAGLLMPRTLLKSAIPKERLQDAAFLAEVARQFQVTTGALGYRLLNEGMITEETRREIDLVRDKVDGETPKLLSASFAALLHDGIASGHVSAGKAAKALSMTRNQLAGLMTEHGRAVPFVL